MLATLLADAVATDLPWVQRSLANVGATLPTGIVERFGDPATVALIGIGTLALVLAVGTFLVSRETGAAFAILSAATVGWFLFPYAEVPWATVLTGTDAQTVAAPASTWWLGGALMATATLEVLISAREHLLATLREAGLPAPPGTPLHDRSRRTLIATITGTLVGGTLIILVYALVRDGFTFGPLADPDLLWVPILLGAVLAGLLWWSTRR